MRFVMSHRWAGDESAEDPKVIRALLAELAGEDPEHPDVSVTVEDGWVVSAFASGLLVFENVDSDEEGGPRHLSKVSRAKAFEVMSSLVTGGRQAVESEAWQPGYY